MRNLVFRLLVGIVCVLGFFWLASCSDTVEPGGDMEAGAEVMMMSLNLQPLGTAGLTVTRVHVLIQKGTFSREMDLEISEETATGVFEGLIPGVYEIFVNMYEGESLIATGTGEGVVVAGQTTTVTIQMEIANGDLEVIVEWGPLPGDSTIAAWDFDEGEGLTVLDDSGHGRDGTVDGASWIAGVSGSALQFDGQDDYVYMPGGEWLTQPKGTIEAWVKIDPEETRGRIISTEAAGWANGLHLNWGTQLSNNEFIDGGIYGGIHSTEGGSHYVETYIDNVSQNQWHFVAMAWDSDEESLLIFVDGASSTVNSPHLGIVDTGEPLTIGCWQDQGNHGHWFNGFVDQVRIYNRALSIEELCSHQEGGENPIVTLASYESANSVHPTSSNSEHWNAQSFSVSAMAGVDSIGVNVLYVRGEPGQLIFALHADAANRPGAVISQFSPIASGSGWLMGPPNSSSILDPGEVYWIVVSSTSSSGAFELEHDLEGTYLDGENLYSYDAGASWVQRDTGNTDILFKVVGQWLNLK
jgi:hypothetical protein